MKNRFTVKMFGEFSISDGEHTITDQANRSKKVWNLLEYILANRDRMLPQKELVELLWSGEDTKDPINTLKVLMHRVRTMLKEFGEDGAQLIIFKKGSYGWNPEVKCSLDTEEFTAACTTAEQTADETEKLELLLKAVSLYEGEFLQKNAAEPWVMELSRSYSGTYLRAAAEAAEILYGLGRFHELITLCQSVVGLFPYEEAFYLYLLQGLVETKQTNQALEEYHKISELFFREFGITPSEKLTAIYKEVVKTTSTMELDLEVIREKLTEEPAPGCFYCEFEFFKMIYRLESRSVARTGQSIYIGLMSVMNETGDALPNQKLMNRVMDGLKTVITRSLRRGDIFTRYSLNQYLIMLPTTTFETSGMVLERIKKAYRREFPNLSVTLRCSTLPVKPQELEK